MKRIINWFNNKTIEKVILISAICLAIALVISVCQRGL